MQPLSHRLFRSFVPAILFSLLTGGILLDVLITERLEEEFDELLVTKARGLMSITEEEKQGLEIENYTVTSPGFVSKSNAEYFMYFNDAGEVLMSSESVGRDGKLPGPDFNPNRKYVNLKLPDGRSGRMIRFRFLPRLEVDIDKANDVEVVFPIVPLGFPGSLDDSVLQVLQKDNVTVTPLPNHLRQPVILQLAIGRRTLDELIRSVHLILLFFGITMMGIIVLLARRGINRELRPLQVMGEQIAALDEEQLSQRLSVDNPVNEIHILSSRFNTLLSRLQSAFERERRFSGDVAHELRTPISELRALIDVSARWPEDNNLRETFYEDAGAITMRMQRTVETLLALSRSEGRSDVMRDCPDLSALVKAAVAEQQQRAIDRGVSFRLSTPDIAVSVRGLEQWQLVLCNLMENAIVYSPEDSVIAVQLQYKPEDTCVVVSVENSVTDLEPEDLPEMFNRLWRKDKARSSTTHSGLGLALVKSSAEQAGIEIDTSLQDSRFKIALTTTLTTTVTTTVTTDSQ